MPRFGILADHNREHDPKLSSGVLSMVSQNNSFSSSNFQTLSNTLVSVIEIADYLSQLRRHYSLLQIAADHVGLSEKTELMLEIYMERVEFFLKEATELNKNVQMALIELKKNVSSN